MLLVQQDSRTGLDVFQSILTALDPEVGLRILLLPPDQDSAGADAQHAIAEQAKQVDRPIAIVPLAGEPGPAILREAKGCDLILLPLPEEVDRAKQLSLPAWIMHVLQNARCRVLLIADPGLPQDLAE